MSYRLIRCLTLLLGAAIAHTQGAVAGASARVSLTTETLCLAARDYLFFAASTTQGIVRIILPGAGHLVIWQNQVISIKEVLVYWPKRRLTDGDFAKCRNLVGPAASSGARDLGAYAERDSLVYGVCRERMPSDRRHFQYLSLNTALLEAFQNGFPDGPSPLGVYLITHEMLVDFY